MLSRKVLNAFIIVFLFLTILFLNSCSNSKDLDSKELNSKVSYTEPYIQAKVIKVISNITLEDKIYNIKLKKIRLLVKILSGSDKNQEIEIEHQITSDSPKIIIPNKGNIVILSERMLPDETTELQIVDYKRTNVIWVAIVILLGLLILVAGTKGLIFLGYIFSIILISTFVFLPLVFWGLNLVFIVLLLAIGISSLTIFAINNLKNKIKNIIWANVSALFLVTIFSIIFVKLSNFNTFPLGDLSTDYFPVSIDQIIISMIILSTLGCIINISIYATNISNSVFKKYNKLPKLKLALISLKNCRNNIFFNFIMMFLIYFSLSLPVILISYNKTLSSVINTSTLAFYIIAVCAGGIGIVTSCFTSSFMTFHYLIESPKTKKTFRQRSLKK